jgi:hypothetical protein
MAAHTLSVLEPSVNNLTAMDSKLGEAYAEPAADVRGFVASVEAPAA